MQRGTPSTSKPLTQAEEASAKKMKPSTKIAVTATSYGTDPVPWESNHGVSKVSVQSHTREGERNGPAAVNELTFFIRIRHGYSHVSEEAREKGWKKPRWQQ